MADFSKDQGGIQKSTDTESDPIEAGVPVTGFDQSPAGEQNKYGPGKGIGNTRQGIR